MPPARRSPAGRSPGRPGTPRPARSTGPKPAGNSTSKPAGTSASKPAEPTAPASRKPAAKSPAPKAVPAAAPTPPVATSMARGHLLERAMVIGGTAIAVALSVMTAIWEVFLSPLYWGSVPLPISPVLAGATTLGLIWFTRYVTGSTGLALLPGMVWFVVMVLATMPWQNGTVLLPSVAWMGLVAVLVGSACWTVAGYWLIVRRR